MVETTGGGQVSVGQVSLGQDPEIVVVAGGSVIVVAEQVPTGETGRHEEIVVVIGMLMVDKTVVTSQVLSIGVQLSLLVTVMVLATQELPGPEAVTVVGTVIVEGAQVPTPPTGEVLLSPEP